MSTRPRPARAAGAAARLRRHDAARRTTRALLEQGLGGICLLRQQHRRRPRRPRRLSAEIRAANPGAVVAVDEEGGDVTRLHTREPAAPCSVPRPSAAPPTWTLTEAVGRCVGARAGRRSGVDPRPRARTPTSTATPTTRSSAPAASAWTRARSPPTSRPGRADSRRPVSRPAPSTSPATATPPPDSHLDLPRIDVDLDDPRGPRAGALRGRGRGRHRRGDDLAHRRARARPRPSGDPEPARARHAARACSASTASSSATRSTWPGASAGRGIPEAAVLALAAGCRPPLPRPRQARRAGAARSSDAIVAAVADGRLTARPARGRRRVAIAAMRVPATATHPEPRPTPARQAGAAASATRSTATCPTSPAPSSSASTPPANIAVGDVAWGLPADRPPRPGSLADGLPDAVPGDVPLVVQVRDAGRRPEVLAFLRALAEDGRPAVVVEWGWPSDRTTSASPTISTRGSSAPGVAAVTQLLRGAGWTR